MRNFKINFVSTKSPINERNSIKNDEISRISSKSGKGINNLLTKIYTNISSQNLSNSSSFISRERHRQLLIKALKNLQRSINLDEIDMAAEEIRNSLNNLSKITGKFEIDEILSIIFKDFCIGK